MATIISINTSALRNSTVSPCSSRASEKAESSFSVRAACRINFLLSHSVFNFPLVAPKPVTRHLVVTARPAEPTRSGPASDLATFQNPPREAYPDEALTHRFRPYGDPGDPPLPPPEDERHAEEREMEMEKEKRKKRRGSEATAVGSPKKAKKAKTIAS